LQHNFDFDFDFSLLWHWQGVSAVC
jgi:hypothetical protein